MGINPILAFTILAGICASAVGFGSNYAGDAFPAILVAAVAVVIGSGVLIYHKGNFFSFPVIHKMSLAGLFKFSTMLFAIVLPMIGIILLAGVTPAVSLGILAGFVGIGVFYNYAFKSTGYLNCAYGARA